MQARERGCLCAATQSSRSVLPSWRQRRGATARAGVARGLLALTGVRRVPGSVRGWPVVEGG